ncbi:BTAD domain-containing putative transcriptional regulator [Saccharopolyspora sp. NPDC050642]|uniref:ATP-binding protein n=1 Tax=Saccharopolyspora sp. NPDC050642 TaxID=3157099 RepID=UPI0033D9045D
MIVELTLLSRVSFRGREITGPRLRGLLALLASDLRTGCSTARLLDGLWPEEQPENPAKALQVLVSRARTQLGSEVIARTPTGYRLAIDEDQVDASAVRLCAAASARHSRSGDHAAALAHAEAGLAFWDESPSDDVQDDPVSALRAERASVHRSLARTRALALSRLGRHAESVEPLAELFRARPRDEEILLELLRCEAATAGPPAALSRYESYRRSLRDELGSDPGPALQELHRQLLRGQAPVVRRGVRHEPNLLLGRADDIAAVESLLRSSRVASIVGTGGLGKTRLAHAVSRQAQQRVVHFVALTGITADDDVVGEVAAALGVGARDGILGIADTLDRGSALLVLDNCEHVIDGVAELVGALVAMAGDVRVLVTSRAPLGLSSESVHLLPELDLPTTVELFEQRARAARPGVELPRDVVAALCRRLDGLPLAVELAAARVRAMSVAEIARRLDDRFGLLRGGARDAPRRHRTLQAVVDWSWSLLEPAGQAAMRALSVFPGGFTADAARALLGEPDVLAELVDQSLLKVTDTASGTRFRMLETVREFSAARCDAAGETDRVIVDFLAWARDFGATQHDSLFGPDPVPVAERIRAERDNLLHALHHAVDRVDGRTVSATAAVLAGLWTVESNYPRLAALAAETARVLSRFEPESELVEATRTATALCTASTFAIDGPRATRSLVALRRLPAAPPDTPIRALAAVLTSDGPALRGLCDSDEPLLAGMANGIATFRYENENDPHGALAAANRMITALDGGSHPWLRALAHGRVGSLAMQVERGEQARHHLRAALGALEELGAWSDVTQLRWAMVLANLQLGDVDEAEQWLALTEQNRADDTVAELVPDLAGRAEISLARGDVDAGLRLWRRAADRLRTAESQVFRDDPRGLRPWTVETRAVAVIAHAQHGRLDLVADIAGELPRTLTAMLAEPLARTSPHLEDFPICGTLLLALAWVDVTGDARSAESGARLIALAERFRFLRGYQPTMSTAGVRRAVELAGEPAYAEAVSAYAGLSRDDLRAAALAALRARDRLSATG